MASTKPACGSRQRPRAFGHSWSAITSVLAGLLVLRLANALSIQTFFQPDEYFQSLEPAWRMAFGPESGAWITWEWRKHLRSSMHPMLFAAVYRAASQLSNAIQAAPDTRACISIVSPKVLQALVAATGDLFTWFFASKLYGPQHAASYAALSLTAFSPWQWYCSTRTFSNSIETTLTIVGLYYWPWRWFFQKPDSKTALNENASQSKADLHSIDVINQLKQLPESGETITSKDDLAADERSAPATEATPDGLRQSLTMAAVACILRPTNIIIWAVVAICLAQRYANSQKVRVLVQGCVLCGSAVLVMSLGMDRAFYGEWTFPPINFLYFNVVNSLSTFYGINRLDYYFTEGLPLLCTTALPFAVIGLWQALRAGTDRPASKGYEERQVTFVMATTILATVLAFTVMAHKEVRFIYPLLPMIHILAAKPLAAFFNPFPIPASKLKLALLMLLLTVNVYIAAYVSLVHQRGVIDVMHYLRQEQASKLQDGAHQAAGNMSVGFLMPCHSTPWRSHLVYPHIEAWALTCEPPLDLTMEERQRYEDEADVFYNHPGSWIDDNLKNRKAVMKLATVEHASRAGDEQRRDWPMYLVFFEHLEPVMNAVLKGTRYEECWRGFNTHWHDDGRRRGDVVVMCYA